MSSQLPLVVGVALSVAGYGLVVLAMETQSERILRSATALPAHTTSGPVSLADCPKPAMTAPPSRDIEQGGAAGLSGHGGGSGSGAGGAGGAAGAAGGGGAGGAGGAAGAAGGGAAGKGGAGGAAGQGGAAGSAVAASGEASLFRFAPGGIMLPKDELARLAAFAQGNRGKGGGKLMIEGHGDEPGTSEKALGLGRRRATVVRQVLADVGIEPERMTISAADAASAPSTVAVRQEGKAP
jgi:hypothetical protein